MSYVNNDGALIAMIIKVMITIITPIITIKMIKE